MAKQPHLADMFVVGKDLKIEYADYDPVDVWITRPSSQQIKKAEREARVERARRQRELTAPDSDEAASLTLQVNEMDRDTLIDTLMSRKRRGFEQQAFNEVVYSPETEKGSGVTPYGKYWGPDAQQYVDLIDMQIKRLKEIQEHNDVVEEEGTGEPINALNDDELLAIEKEYAEFEKQSTERADQLARDERLDYKSKSMEALQEELRKVLVDAEVDMVWYAEWQRQLMYYAVRYPDNHSKLYFANPDQYDSLPLPIQSQIYEEYTTVDMGTEQTKNLLTPLPS